ncbi:hypothetical protein CRG98_026498 [Punica granatum]|uniref:Uncharacterized protein n=1 Tax=Punica granatum TaxID=22663 RepID=A0A2I0JA36_PUNGR|nr:hypothetical protein CRG98_026498 [Punica granatum]
MPKLRRELSLSIFGLDGGLGERRAEVTWDRGARGRELTGGRIGRGRCGAELRFEDFTELLVAELLVSELLVAKLLSIFHPAFHRAAGLRALWSTIGR